MEGNASDLEEILIRVRRLLDGPSTVPPTTTPPPTGAQPQFDTARNDEDVDEVQDNEEYSPPSSIASSPWASPRQTSLELEDADLHLTKSLPPQAIEPAQLLVGMTLLDKHDEIIVDGHEKEAGPISPPLDPVPLLDILKLPTLCDLEHVRCGDSDDEDDQDDDGAYGDAEDSPSSSDSSSPSTSPTKPSFAFPFHQYTEMDGTGSSNETAQQRCTLDDIDLETKAGVFRRPFSTRATIGQALNGQVLIGRYSRGRTRGASTSATIAPSTSMQEKQPRKWYSTPNLKPGVPRVSTRGATTLTKLINSTITNARTAAEDTSPPAVECSNLSTVDENASEDSDSSSSSSEASGSTTAEGTLSTVSTCSGIKVVYRIRQPTGNTRKRGQAPDS